MDIQTDSIIQKLLEDIQGQITTKIETVIHGQIQQILNEYDFENKINLLTSLKLDNKLSNIEVRPIDIEARINDAASTVIDGITNQARRTISADIARKIDGIDFQGSITNAVAQQVEARLKKVVFPENSISFRSIKQDEIEISGSSINGGIIQNFSSTGIDDRATNVAVTILDEHTVVENNLIAASADVRGSLVVNGDLILHGTLPTDSPGFKNIVADTTSGVLASLDDNLFSKFSDIIFKQIQEQGVDLNRITVNGAEIIVGNSLGSGVTRSNLTRVGMLEELQTQGETLLSESLYVSQKRVGINTIEPGYALTVWDQEVEIITAKRSQNTGVIGTVRQQSLVLSSNSKTNIICDPDGSVIINRLQLGTVPMSSSTYAPSTDQPKGTIVWNSNPEIGQPIGWVSLGNARWAKFGLLAD